MKKISVLASALLMAIVVVFVSPIKADAYGPGPCEDRYVTSFFAVEGHPIDMDDVYEHSDQTLPLKLCRFGNIRVFKAEANTLEEIQYLKKFANTYAQKHGPIGWCQRGMERAAMIHLGYFYFANIQNINADERAGWRPWLRNYVSNNDDECSIIVGRNTDNFA